MTVWVCGNSQSRALSKGLSAISDHGYDLRAFVLGNAKYELTDYSRVEDDVVGVTVAEYGDNLERETGSRHFDRSHVWGFCQGTHNARIFRHEFWNKCDPNEIADPRRRPISLAVLDTIIEADQKHIKLFHQRLNQTGTRFFVVSCPPPRGDHPCIESGTRTEAVLYIDRRARALMKEHLATLDVPFIDYPPETETPEHLLKPEFYAPDRPGVKDAHHANAEYGSMMIRRVFDFLTSAGFEGPPNSCTPDSLASVLSAA